MGPIRGQTRPLPVAADIVPETRHINAKLNASIHNRFDIEVIDSETGEVKQKAYAENIILDKLWTMMFSSNSSDRVWNKSIHYGSGTGTPIASRTSLFTFVGAIDCPTTNDVYNFDSAKDVISLRRKVVLTETVAVGVTLTEIGIAYGSTAATLCTHAMLKDMNGNQISIAKTSTDIINIYATVFCHFGNSFRNFWGLDASSALLSYALGMCANPMWNFPRYFCCDGTTSTDISGTAVYAAATKTITITGSRVAANSGNGRGFIGIMDNSNGIAYAYGWFSGSSITGEAIGTGNGANKNFATVFGFVKSGAKIYVDGVEQVSGVTVDIGVPNVITNLMYCLRVLDSAGKLKSGVGPTFFSNGNVGILYNPNYDKFGITRIYSADTYGSFTIECSNDLSTWVTLGTSVHGSDGVTISATYKNYKYFRLSAINGNYGLSFIATSTDLTAYNIHFDTAPASGAVVTGDYTTALIAKDANHVLDTTIVMSFGEKVV